MVEMQTFQSESDASNLTKIVFFPFQIDSYLVKIYTSIWNPMLEGFLGTLQMFGVLSGSWPKNGRKLPESLQ